MVKSCDCCNSHSDESLLKSFMMFLDERIMENRLPHLRHPQGQVDLRRIMAVCSAAQDKTMRAYPDESITGLFRKIFMGLRNHLLKEKWTFIEKSRFAIVRLCRVTPDTGYTHIAYALPMRVDGQNQGFSLPPAFCPNVEVFDYRFRDFSFGIKDYRDAENMMIGLKYQRQEFNHLLYYCCVLDQAVTSETVRSPL